MTGQLPQASKHNPVQSPPDQESTGSGLCERKTSWDDDAGSKDTRCRHDEVKVKNCVYCAHTVLCDMLLSTLRQYRLKTLTFVKERELVAGIEASTKSKGEIAFLIPKNTFFTILRKKLKILWSANSEACPKNRKRVRGGKNPKLQERLAQWIRAARAQNNPIAGPVLEEKVTAITSRLGIDDFHCSDSWPVRFKGRHGLKLHAICCEFVDAEVVEDWKDTELQDLLQQFKPGDVLSVGETGLFYKILPSKTVAFKDDLCGGDELSKERLIVLVGPNMTGTENFPPLIAGKYANPRYFCGVHSLPTGYESTRNAWIAKQIFEKWMQKLDRMYTMSRERLLWLWTATQAFSLQMDLNIWPCTSSLQTQLVCHSITIKVLPRIWNTTTETGSCCRSWYRWKQEKHNQVNVPGAIHMSVAAREAVDQQPIGIASQRLDL